MMQVSLINMRLYRYYSVHTSILVPYPIPVIIIIHPLIIIQAQVGGGEGVEGIYGSIGMSGMSRIFSVLISKCGLDSSSVFLDVGTGLGRCGSFLLSDSQLHQNYCGLSYIGST